MKLKILTIVLVGIMILGVVAQNHFSENQIKALEKVLQDFPAFAMEIENLKKSNDPDARNEIKELRAELLEMLEFKIEEPIEYERESKLNKLETRSIKLAEQIKQARQTGKEEKEKMTQELQETLKKEFELRLEGQKLEIDELESELSDLRYELESNKNNRDTVIRDRFDEVTEGSVEW